MLSQFDVLFLTSEQLAGPLLASLLQATFLVTERIHEHQLAAALPTAFRRPASTAKGRQFFYWLRRLGLAIALLKIGHLDGTSFLWLVPGVALFALGMGVRWLAVATLGRLFSRQLMIQSDHVLVTSGLYRHIRHPAYTGTLLCNCGIGLVTLNWISGLVIIGTTVVLLRQRIRIEEELMIEAFGEEYEDYRRGTICLVPWIY
jgi:protein-S-isoprenylcysteine O-methyltransferase Ste14